MTSYDDASDGHPDLAEIDALRTGEADAAIREHVDRCTRCAETLAALEDEARALSGLRREAREEDTDADRRAVETIFAEAARIRGSARRRGLLLRIASAAAAVLLLAVGLQVLQGRDPEPRVPKVNAGDPHDVDGSGAVDIVDAYHVARRLHRKVPAPEAWDVNDDGAVNDGDVRTIAMLAVSVSGSER